MGLWEAPKHSPRQKVGAGVRHPKAASRMRAPQAAGNDVVVLTRLSQKPGPSGMETRKDYEQSPTPRQLMLTGEMKSKGRGSFASSANDP